MENYKEKEQEIYFKYGKCCLKDLADSYRQKGEPIPSALIKYVFKKVAQIILFLFSKGYYHTDIKIPNLILDQIYIKNKS